MIEQLLIVPIINKVIQQRRQLTGVVVAVAHINDSHSPRSVSRSVHRAPSVIRW